jgi:hypothetical protein
VVGRVGFGLAGGTASDFLFVDKFTPAPTSWASGRQTRNPRSGPALGPWLISMEGPSQATSPMTGAPGRIMTGPQRPG